MHRKALGTDFFSEKMSNQQWEMVSDLELVEEKAVVSVVQLVLVSDLELA
jgi:hypothetical protein